MVLLGGGITATGVGGARFVAGRLVRAGTGAAGDAALEVEADVAEDAVLEVEAIVAKRAVVELGGSACRGTRLIVERLVVVAGSTVATTPSTIVIVV